ncbi:MurR/RpiR family transcriptional regulator [Sphingobium sp. H39-3-25]|uniref:MurR/RpiR family transcriptional regulator n=1 Tax=Sphingobium arseniciresistens TaxID=3030834 RepID=UPI0023BA17A3|nr:MurR/RpiR family transcriptional regulator [Sphingobium arseniciresistens]
MSFADRIKQHSDQFTPGEQRIAEVLFSTNLLAGLDTVVKLGERARVSGPTVIRFATKIGFDSYPDMQASLRLDIESRLASPLDLYERQSGEGDTLSAQAADIFSEAIRRSLTRIDAATLDKVANLLADGSHAVYVLGGRFTHHLAEILWGHLHQLRPRAYVLRGGVVSPRDHLVDIGRRDVLVVFDIRRYQEDVIELAEFAKLRRATIVLVTDPLLSPIARIASHVLTCDLDAPSPYDSLVPCMAVVELMIAAITRAASEKGRERIVEIEQIRRFGEQGTTGEEG